MITRQQLEQLVTSVVRVFKGRRSEQAAFAIAALCFSGGLALGDTWSPSLSNRLQLGLYVAGLFSLAYAGLRVWRLVHLPELPPPKDRPSAIKGPMAFTEADGELFRKLGRESELETLLGLVLDDQILMVVVRGASGAGKTSLLRAGLKHIVGGRAIFHYWEAVPTEPDKGLLRAIQQKWPEGATKPATLDELINPLDSLGRQSHVIVLDQFEQLRGNKKIVQLIRRTVRESKPPHRITWVIAFREELLSNWMKSIANEYEGGFHPPLMFLGLFTEERAREVIGQLVNESNLKDSIEQSVINNLVEAAIVEGEVSPVDIGIGLLVLAELNERHSNQTITIRDYQFAGGAEGLLTQYISRCLELFPREIKEGILKAMLSLRGPEETGQRLAKGATIAELAAEAGIDSRGLKKHLKRLADRDIRLLETCPSTDDQAIRYRLPHERFIPALNRLTGKMLAEVDQARMKFQNAFHAWKTNDKRSHYLLKAKDLRLIKRYETQIPWGNDEQEKKGFLNRSKLHRRFMRIGIAAAALILITSGWIAYIKYQEYEHRRYLSEAGYPRELYDWQYQLKKLELTEPLDLERFKWLSSGSIEELELHALPSSNSLSGLTSLSKCRNLRSLTLDLSRSQVTDLTPLEQLKGLTHLSLNLDWSPVSDLKPLAQLKGLTHLSLNGMGMSPGNDLELIGQLKGLTHLSLELRPGPVTDLTPLAQLQILTQLSLSVSAHHVTDLTPLQQLKHLRQLSLHLSYSEVRDLTPLAQLNELKELSLDLRSSQVHDLRPLLQLKKLTHLWVYFYSDEQRRLSPIRQLEGLTLLLHLHPKQVNDLMSLQQFRGLTQLSLDLSSSELSDLTPLQQLPELTELWLFYPRGISDLTPLQRLGGLTRLSLLEGSSSELSDLTPLQRLQELKRLSLDLRHSQVHDLKPLQRLTKLTELSINLSKQVRDLTALQQLQELTQLSLDTSFSEIGDLTPLQELKLLTRLSLKVRVAPDSVSKVTDLQILSNLPQLQRLSIEYATNQQRKSLRTIPADLVELKF